MFGKKKDEGARLIPQRETPSRFSKRIKGQAEVSCDEHKLTEPFLTWTEAQRIRHEHNIRHHR
ncbi:hypothetical protein GCM10027168_05760 [Streptomyces capparidis]